jgi:Ni,Fe-hydrogenase III small subunit
MFPVTGSVLMNVKDVLLRTYSLISEQKIVMAAADCDINSRIPGDPCVAIRGADRNLPVDYSMPGDLPTYRRIISSFLEILISFIAVFSSSYTPGYVKHYCKKQSIGGLGFFCNIFIGSVVFAISAERK